MKNFFKIFTLLIFKDRIFQILFGLAVIVNLIIWALLYWKFALGENFGDMVPLHYNVYFGIDFVGKWYKIFVIPSLGIFFIIINFFLADIIYLRDKIVSYFLLGTSAFTQILLGLAAYMIILINQ